MKNIICGLVLLGAVSAFADDSYLYWMVGNDAPSDYAYALVYDQTSAGYLNIYDSGFDSTYTVDHRGSEVGGVTAAQVADFKDFGEGFYAKLAATPASASSFIIELYNSEGRFLAQSGPLAYSSAAIYTGGMATPPSSTTTFTGFAIPEPNSALLMLVGCAMLGLRRRKLKVA